MDATRPRDGKQVMLKKILPAEGPHELTITQFFSSPELVRDPRNHCVPLLGVIEIPATGQKLMILPFLRPFNNPHFQTFGEFVAFFAQVCEVRYDGYCRRESTLIGFVPGSPIYARAKRRTPVRMDSCSQEARSELFSGTVRSTT